MSDGKAVYVPHVYMLVHVVEQYHMLSIPAHSQNLGQVLVSFKDPLSAHVSAMAVVFGAHVHMYSIL